MTVGTSAKEIAAVFSQGDSLEKLEDNIRDAYKL